MPSHVKDYTFQLAEKAIDDYRNVKVICVGAGYSGICTAIRFPQRIANLSLTIYEKNADLGGTWFENRYPGVACDIPSPAYQFTFESWSQWSEFYSSGQEIQQYLKMVSKKYGAEKYIKKRHMVTGATWKEDEAIWSVEVRNLETGEVFTDTCDFLVMATGILNQWDWPDIPGLKDFQGKLLHSADWDDSYDVRDKEIALIGGGSSGIQILPAIQPIVKRIDHYNHSKMWIASGGFAAEEAFRRNPTGGNSKYTPEELEAFRDDPLSYLKYRAYVESLLNTVHTVTWADSELARESEKIFRESMKQKLATKPEVFESMNPSYPPVCRRITPGPNYLESICKANCEFISTNIKRIHMNGIETADGKVRNVDAIITATGFDTSYLPRFPVTGRGGLSLEQVWDDPYPEAYVSVFARSMPNYMIYLGPNGAPPSGSTVLAIESQCEYIIKCIQKCQREGYRTMEVKHDALKAFSGYIDSYMPRTVYSKPCKSWFKRGLSEGRVVALFPGSATAFRQMLMHPRWEDFHFTPAEDTTVNSFGWLGVAMTRGEMDKSAPTPYLDSIDVPPIPGMI
ncbi:flavin-binding monooxygenase [Rhizodiscina lignyota]|uniref:Flavin-binding monooxygenase n=1 Tax=Rhizodiscina lignyota TaxID=1504668 RepID=A0A9P4M952_9PEZI|nr:flavin-binding monooxygenase [Rhizodiscina lignyota]